MSHHIAELIQATEISKTKKAKTEASSKATDAILRTWKYRQSLPGNAYPLNRYKEILGILDRLAPQSNPYMQHDVFKSVIGGEKVHKIFQLSNRLIVGLLLLSVNDQDNKESTTETLKLGMTNEENSIIDALGQWEEMFPRHDRGYEVILEEKREPETLPNLSQLVRETLKDLIIELQELSDAFPK